MSDEYAGIPERPVNINRVTFRDSSASVYYLYRMSKKLQVAVTLGGTLLVVFLALGVGTYAGFAEGSSENESKPEAPGTAASVTSVLGADVESAVALASEIPGDWDYDPAARVIHPEHAGLSYPVTLPDSVWRDLLSPNEYYILRQKGTEPAFTHPLNNVSEKGIFYSRATGQPLFSTDDKYESRSGWPSFTRPINPGAIVYLEDNSLFARRIEVVDSLSGSHLGHVFPDGPAPTRQRYCINGAALVFVAEGGEPPDIVTAAP